MKMVHYCPRAVALSIIRLCVGLGCKDEVVFQPDQPTVVKEPTQSGCSDGTCCNKSPKFIFEYEETVVGEPVVLGGPPYDSDWGLGFDRGVPSRSGKPFYNRVAEICDLCHDKVKGLSLSPAVITRDTTFKPDYRVWGRIYTGANITVTGREPVRFIYIDRIERLK